MLKHAEVAQLNPGKVLYLRGTPYEQGKQLGQGAADLIRANIRAALALRDQRNAGYDAADYRAIARTTEAFASRAYPELLDELHGVAEGAAVDYEDLLHLNLNTHLAYGYNPVKECTQVVAAPPATVDGKTYVGKTRDLARGPMEHVLLHREYDDGTFLNEFQGAGQATLPCGVNRWGLSLTTSGQWSRRVTFDLTRVGAAWSILNLKPLLRTARSVDDVIALVKEQPRVAGMNLVAVDPRRAVALEVTADDVAVCEAEDGLLVRTNHFLPPPV